MVLVELEGSERESGAPRKVSGYFRFSTVEYVRKVLMQLCEASLFAKISKCEFFVQKTKFLGLIIR